MSQWTRAGLDAIAAFGDLHISHSVMTATYGTPTWVWSVSVGDSLYVRAYNGQKSQWYQAAMQQKAGRIMAANMEREVAFRPADISQQAAIDSVYKAEYGSSYLSQSNDQ